MGAELDAAANARATPGHPERPEGDVLDISTEASRVRILVIATNGARARAARAAVALICPGGLVRSPFAAPKSLACDATTTAQKSWRSHMRRGLWCCSCSSTSIGSRSGTGTGLAPCQYSPGRRQTAGGSIQTHCSCSSCHLRCLTSAASRLLATPRKRGAHRAAKPATICSTQPARTRMLATSCQ